MIAAELDSTIPMQINYQQQQSIDNELIDPSVTIEHQQYHHQQHQHQHQHHPHSNNSQSNHSHSSLHSNPSYNNSNPSHHSSSLTSNNDNTSSLSSIDTRIPLTTAAYLSAARSEFVTANKLNQFFDQQPQSQSHTIHKPNIINTSLQYDRSIRTDWNSNSHLNWISTISGERSIPLSQTNNYTRHSVDSRLNRLSPRSGRILNYTSSQAKYRFENLNLQSLGSNQGPVAELVLASLKSATANIDNKPINQLFYSGRVYQQAEDTLNEQQKSTINIAANRREYRKNLLAKNSAVHFQYLTNNNNNNNNTDNNPAVESKSNNNEFNNSNSYFNRRSGCPAATESTNNRLFGSGEQSINRNNLRSLGLSVTSQTVNPIRTAQLIHHSIHGKQYDIISGKKL